MCLRRFSAEQKIALYVEKNIRFWASYSTSNRLLFVARHILVRAFKNVFKVGSVYFANSLSPPSIVKKAPEVK